MNTAKVLVDRLVKFIMEEDDSPLFDPIQMADVLLIELEDNWDDIPQVTRIMMAHVAAGLKQHYADGVAEQLFNRMKR